MLYNVDLSIFLFPTRSNLIGMIFPLFSLNCPLLFSARSINFRSFLSPGYLNFFSFLNNFMLSFSSENSTLFSLVFSFSKMFLASCNILFYISIFAFYHTHVSTWLMFSIYIVIFCRQRFDDFIKYLFFVYKQVRVLLNIFSSVFFLVGYNQLFPCCHTYL